MSLLGIPTIIVVYAKAAKAKALDGKVKTSGCRAKAKGQGPGLQGHGQKFWLERQGLTTLTIRHDFCDCNN